MCHLQACRCGYLVCMRQGSVPIRCQLCAALFLVDKQSGKVLLRSCHAPPGSELMNSVLSHSRR